MLSLQFEKDWDRDREDEETEGEEVNTATSSSNNIPTGGGTVEKRITTPLSKKTGFMVTGSSDCSICVWDLHLGPLLESDDDSSSVHSISLSSNESADHHASKSSTLSRKSERDEGERTVTAEVRAILKGHGGGVLDLRIDKKWIVSW